MEEDKEKDEGRQAGDPRLPEGDDAAGDELALHQPPNSTDLDRHPAAGPDCVAVRGLLRDYADQDLSAAERIQVEDHAHACRDCAVALSRVEAEAYRLRRAFGGPPVAGPSSDFVRNVMVRVHAEDAAEKEGRRPVADVSADFTPRVMERIRREWRRPSVADRALVLLRQHGFLLLGAAAAAVFLLWSRLGSPRAAVGLHVQTVAAGTLRRDGREMPLVAGEELQFQDQVKIAAESRGGPRPHLSLAVVDAARGTDRAIVELDAGTEITVLAPRDGSPLFRVETGSSSMTVNAGERIAFMLAGDVSVALDPGTFAVAVERVARYDGELGREPFFGVRLAAKTGRASVRRGAAAPFTVEDGTAALFDGWSAVAFEPCPPDARRSWPRRYLAPPPSEPESMYLSHWIGRVLNGESKAAVAGATVVIRYPGRPETTVFTAEDGTFKLESFDVGEGAVALVDVRLPEGGAWSFDVANYSGTITLRSVGKGPRGERWLDPILLAGERPVMGTVLDPDGVPLPDASVTPVLLDTLSGGAKRMQSVVVSSATGPDGKFVLRRLPATLPPHVGVCLLVEHAKHGAVAAMDLLAGPSLNDRSLTVVMARREHVTVALAPGRTVEVLSSIRNLAPAMMLAVTHLTVPKSGVAEMEVAEGASLWVREGGNLVALSPVRGRPGALEQVDGIVPTQVVALANSARSRTGNVLASGVWRYDEVFTGGTERRTIALMDRDGHDFAGARLFVVSKVDGSIGYLGEMNSSQAEWMLPTSDYRVVAVDDLGKVGVVDGNELQENMLRVRVLAHGSARLPSEIVTGLQPSVDQSVGFAVFELEMLDPLRGYVVYRHAGRESDWEMRGLIPGTYRLIAADGSGWVVRVPPGGVAEFKRE